MPELLNTLYVQTQGTLLSLESDTVRVKVDGRTVLRVPLMRLEGIVMFGNISITPFLVHRCAQDGRLLVWLTRFGRFRARVQGPTRGNVLLRRVQHEALDDPTVTTHIARQLIAAKIQNTRGVLLRAAREVERDEDHQPLAQVCAKMATILARLPGLDDLNQLRGAEGEAARAYFHVLSLALRQNRSQFAITGRNRRPPRDRLNALLSFLYALVRGECEAAAETVGLDPQVGFLHALRPGRPALALDLMEPLRPVLADRLALTLINRRQIQPQDFEQGVRLTDKGRKTVIEAYQERKGTDIRHRVLDRKVPLGLVAQVQARLLARYLRAELDTYPPYVHRQ